MTNTGDEAIAEHANIEKALPNPFATRALQLQSHAARRTHTFTHAVAITDARSPPHSHARIAVAVPRRTHTFTHAFAVAIAVTRSPPHAHVHARSCSSIIP